jgi:hypothetical protein
VISSTILKDYIFPTAYSLLPAKMNNPSATKELVAIGHQESRFKYRAQINGPARGFWQFEKIAVEEVLTNGMTKESARYVCEALSYPLDVNRIHTALEHNDILAACFARLFLWRLPDPLPTTEQSGWDQYIEAWKPGKPKPASWPTAWHIAGTITEVM